MHPQELAQLFDHVPQANWNGELLPLTEVRVSVLDRAFLFGDAIYEVMRLYGGRAFLREDHLQRLQRNLEKMAFPAEAAVIAARMDDTIAASGVQEGMIYVQVTRGVAVRTHRFPEPAPEPNVLIYVSRFSDPYTTLRSQGVPVITVPDLRWKRCDIKSVNLLANCMAAQQAHEAGCPEALLVNEQGELIEGSRTSLFGVRDGEILTAPLGPNILPGITRRFLMQLADDCQLSLAEQTLHASKLNLVDELFLTGTTTEILPIIAVNNIPIGNGTVGPVTQRLLQAYQERVEAFRKQPV